MSKIRFVGLDVHADTIAAAVAEPDGEVRSLGVYPNRLESLRKLVTKLEPAKDLKACYEAGPTGYVLYWQLTALGVACEVIAPSLVPVKAGDRVKTDRRDAVKLARSYRAGDLTAVWVPDADHEALRDLVRAREDARQDQHRARHRLSKFLLRHGRRPPETVKKGWTLKYMTWIKEKVHFDQPALEATLLDYVHEVDHMAERIERLEKAITSAIEKTPPEMRAVVAALQAGSRTGQTLPLSQSPGTDGLQRPGLQRAHHRQPRPTRLHHENRKRSLAACRRRIGLGLPVSAGRELLGFMWAIAVATEAKFKTERKAA